MDYSDDDDDLKDVFVPTKFKSRSINKSASCVDIYRKINPFFNYKEKLFHFMNKNPFIFPFTLNSGYWNFNPLILEKNDYLVFEFKQIDVIFTFKTKVKEALIQCAWKRVFSREVLWEFMAVVLHPDRIIDFYGSFGGTLESPNIPSIF